MYSAKSSSGSQLRTAPANWEGKGFLFSCQGLGRMGWHRVQAWPGLALPTAPGPPLLDLSVLLLAR